MPFMLSSRKRQKPDPITELTVSERQQDLICRDRARCGNPMARRAGGLAVVYDLAERSSRSANAAGEEWRNKVPSVEENLQLWNVDFDWSREDWAKGVWSSSSAMWYGFVYPRIWRFLPVPTMLEIAPGFGRWTEFLLDHCDSLIGIDIADKCIAACRRRFADRPGAIFEVNDGHSLPMVADSSVDFAFSFDSLVHVEADPLKEYLAELNRVLKPDGVAFLHHSNYGAYQHFTNALPILGAANRLPDAWRLRLEQIGILNNPGWRATSVSAARFTELCDQAGMRCVGQELVNWTGGVILQDSISVVTRPGSRWDRPNRVVKNWLYRLAARPIRRSDSVYNLSAQAEG